MELGSKIVKKIIVILEGCVVKLKELDAYLSERHKDESVRESGKRHKYSDSIALEETGNQYDRNDYYNISELDQYMENVGLPIGSNFMKLIQRIEVMTEYNISEVLLSSLSNIDDFYSIFNSIKDCEFVKFEYLNPSPIRKEEERMVDSVFVHKELAEVGLTYDDNKSLYFNSLRILEEKQKKVMKEIVVKLQDAVEKTKNLTEEPMREKAIYILRNELNSRMSILNIKKKRN